MAKSSRRQHRPWTAHEQATAEVAAACGVSVLQIAKALSRDHKLIRYKLIQCVSSQAREYSREWARNNPEEHARRSERWRRRNRKHVRQQDRERYRRWRENNPDKVHDLNARRRAAYAAKRAAANALLSADFQSSGKAQVRA